MRKFAWAIAFVAVAFSCKQKDKNASGSNKNKPDVLAANMDTLVSPATDFFSYANGGWIKKNPIPGDQSRWGIAETVIEENQKRMREICDNAAKEKAAKGTSSQKIGDFWATAMDSAKIEQDGINPIQPFLQQVDAVKDIPSLLALLPEFEKNGIGHLIGFGVGQDQKNSEVNALYTWQGGLGLPDREFYFKPDSSSLKNRNGYVVYMGKMLGLLGQDSNTAKTAATQLMALETELAGAHRKIEDLRNPYANYNKMAITDMGKLAPSVNWADYTAKRGIKNTDTVIVGQPEYFAKVEQLLKKIPIETWKNYLRIRIAEAASPALPDRFGQTRFEFNKLLSGAKERKPRWKRMMDLQEGVMGEMLGQLYVKEFFNETAKKRYENLVEEIRNALKERIGTLTWMTDSTKQKAYAKLASIKKKVGYPDKWKDFSKMEIGRESLFRNLMNATKWWDDYQLNKLGQPVDRDEWGMFPQTYNAYYNPSNNEIVLPAGIFTVPGYRDEELDDATVYGYAGASTIGHEITHGFDDEGRQYDAKGNLTQWWQKKDEEEFSKRAAVMVEQFNNIEVIDKMKINGKATLGENIADLGGVLLGLHAYKKTEEYKKGEKKAGLTPLQRYFLGYSIGWLGDIKPEALKTQLMSNVHSPAKYRVNGIFWNVDDFYTAFNIPKGSPMYMEENKRVKIW
ncbi:MAG: M13 family metallopeptidase [Dinghuibacter sp.]|nr:M13 family metallopeptidase [Dinghuibacter sp.]